MTKRPTRFRMERLEDRQLMAGDVAAVLPSNIVNNMVNVAGYHSAASMNLLGGAHGPNIPTIPPTQNQPLTEEQLDIDMGLPMLDSKPGAAHILYLDFNGHFEATWSNDNGTFHNITTPPFDSDYNLSHFGPDDQDMIRKVWAAVAEDYAPFDVNVTTHYYGDFNDGHALRVAIGGLSTDWYVDPAQPRRPTGTSNTGSFDDPAKSNTVFVFADEYNGFFIEHLKLATTISHEAGHGFGLRHQGVYDADGHKTSEYDPGTADWTPIMGDNNSTDRTTWNLGRADDGLQDDMAFLSWKLGNRADDHGDIWSTGTFLNQPLNINGAMIGSGMINAASDADAFLFSTAGGKIDVSVKGLEWCGNLMPVVEVYNNFGLITRAEGIRGDVNSANMMSAKLTANLPAGVYMVLVKGAGDYGDVGQYTLSVVPQKVGSLPTGPVVTPGKTQLGPGKLAMDAYYAELGGPDGGQQRTVATATVDPVSILPVASRLLLKRDATASADAAATANTFDEVFSRVGAA